MQLMFFAFFPPVAKAELDTHAFVDLTKEMYLLQNIDSRPCNEDVTEADTGQCQLEQMEQYLIRRGYKCVPPHVKDLFPAFNDKLCTNTTELRTILLEMSEQMAKIPIAQSELFCPVSCVANFIVVETTPFRFTVLDDFPEDKRMILIGFENGFVQTTEEYFLYTPVSILTATGGAMGMFLGWSLFQNYNVFIVLLRKVSSTFARR